MRTRAEIIFDVVDVLFHNVQNSVKYPHIKVEKDVGYSAEFAEDRLADLYYDPKIETPYPVFINIHGGGFVRGDKKHRVSFSGMVANEGYFVINVNHRNAPQYPFPAAVEDMVELLNRLPALKEKYNLNIEDVTVSGDSAGAYYAMAAAVASRSAEYRAKVGLAEVNPEVKVKALLGFCGPYDVMLALTKPLAFGMTRSIGRSFTGMDLDKKCSNISEYKYLDCVSPAPFIDANWDLDTFFVYSKKDFLCAGHGESICKQFDDLGLKYKQFVAEKFSENHCFHLMAKKPGSKKCLQEVCEWLRERSRRS